MIDKETQRIAWSCLPKEFKEKVNEYYNNPSALGVKGVLLLENLFGCHNLTSDAEGEEDEVLYVSRKKLQYFYEKLRAIGEDQAAFTLQSLFGSKCLPDETLSQNPPESCDTEKHISTDCDKAAEPELKVGDVVRIKPNAADYHQGYQNGYAWLPERNKYVGKVFSIINVWPSGAIVLNIPDNVYWEAIDLEPYTEPTEKNPKESDETFAFDSERRLNIAAMMMQAIYVDSKRLRPFPDLIAQQALVCADALIAESAKKGGAK